MTSCILLITMEFNGLICRGPQQKTLERKQILYIYQAFQGKKTNTVKCNRFHHYRFFPHWYSPHILLPSPELFNSEPTHQMKQTLKKISVLMTLAIANSNIHKYSTSDSVALCIYVCILILLLALITLYILIVGL